MGRVNSFPCHGPRQSHLRGGHFVAIDLILLLDGTLGHVKAWGENLA
jgi:hypothetical protein